MRSTGQVPPEAWGLFLGSMLTRPYSLIKFDQSVRLNVAIQRETAIKPAQAVITIAEVKFSRFMTSVERIAWVIFDAATS